ncbi:MAG: hypothetical protein ACRDAM_07115, partial [Casimicrobium sp.]
SEGTGDCGWWEGERLRRFIEAAIASYNVDTNRIYVTGLSMGGAGTVLVARAFNPPGTATINTIAATLSICQAEGGAPALNEPLRNMPMWLAHAYDDPQVNWGESRFFLDGVTEEIASITSGFDYTDSNGPPKPDIDSSQTLLYNVSSTVSSATPAIGHRWLKSDTISDAAINADHNIRQRFTVYKDGAHSIWNRAYNDANIMSWLFKQRLNETPQTCNLDINAGGAFDMKDARAAIMWMLGFRGTVLENAAGFSGVNAAAIDQFLTRQQASGALDLDGDNTVRATTDGLMLLRIALGFTDGAAITNRAINASGSRGTWNGVLTHRRDSCKLTSLQ